MLKRAIRSATRGVGTRSMHDDARSIGVLGAGLAGLTLTLHLARHLPSNQRHRIVLYDADQRVGGWVRSDRLSIKGKAKAGSDTANTALVEAGPRSIRPVGLPGFTMLDLVSCSFGKQEVV